MNNICLCLRLAYMITHIFFVSMHTFNIIHLVQLYLAREAPAEYKCVIAFYKKMQFGSRFTLNDKLNKHLVRIWISNCLYIKLGYVITYQCPNFSDGKSAQNVYKMCVMIVIAITRIMF